MRQQQAFVSSLILAAGTASRLGQPKQLLPWGETTILGQVVAQVEASPVDEVVVVIGHKAEEVRRSVTPQRARLIEAPDFGEGCTASIRTGLAGLSSQAEAVVLILGDQPRIDPAVMQRVVAEWRRTRALAIRTAYPSRAGHPLVFAKILFPDLMTLHGDKAVWKILAAHPEWVHNVVVNQPFPGDVNTWEDYHQLLSATAVSS